MTETKTKKAEIATTQNTGGALALPQGYTGLEEVSSLNDLMLVYFRLLQKEDESIPFSFGGALVDTLTNKVVDIRGTKGKPIIVVPLAILKDYEIYKPATDNAGRLDASKFGPKVRAAKEHDPIVREALSANNKEGTRRSYIVTDKNGEVEYLVQQNNKVFVYSDGSIYCLSLRSSKITQFFKKWRTLMGKKTGPSDNILPIFTHKYALSSIKMTNALANADYWNFEINDAGPVPEAEQPKILKAAQDMISMVSMGKNIDIQGNDID